MTDQGPPSGPAGGKALGAPPAVGRLADVSAVLRLMRPLHGRDPDNPVERRRLLADLLRLVGRDYGPPAVVGEPVANHGGGLPRPPTPTAGPRAKPAGDPPHAPFAPPPASDATAPVHELPPRMVQTLELLLTGDSEKQVAQRLHLSPHTVHVYVKKLYRHFDVSSRAELLARHLRR